MGKTIAIKDLHNKMYTMLYDIENLCQKYDVTYYLFAGTLIGAMRHQGFIPWDDDADIIMTRDNWDKFVAAFNKEKNNNIVLSALDLNENLGMPVNHYVDKNTTTIYRYHLTNPEIAGIPIDIQVMDYLPNDKEAYYQYVDDVEELQDFTNPVYYYGLRKLKTPGTPTNVEEKYELAEKFGRRYVIDLLIEKLTKYNQDECDFLVQRYGGAPIIYPKELFGKPRYVKFGDGYLPVPHYAEEVLFLAYGDWMNIPRSGSTLSQHDFSLRSLNIPSSAYFSLFNRKISKEEIVSTYRGRKLLQEKNVAYMFNSKVNTDVIYMRKVAFDCQNKINTKEINELLTGRNYEKLEELLEEYINSQTSEMFSGSPSITGWKRWYRRNCPLLIDVDDIVIVASIYLLLKKDELSKAYSIMKARDFSSKEKSEEFEIAKAILLATIKANYCFCAEEYDVCKNLVEEYLPKFVDNCRLWILSYRLNLLNNVSTSEDAKLEYGIEKFESSDEICSYYFENLIDKQEYEKAYELLDNLIFSTNNGVVLNRVKTKLLEIDTTKLTENLSYMLIATKYRMCEDLTDEEKNLYDARSRLIDGDLSSEQQTSFIMKTRMELLNEIDSICRENNIEYVIWGDFLAKVIANRCDENTEIVIAMSGNAIKAFLDYCENHKKDNRFVDCMKTNSCCSDFEIRYCDTSSLDFDIKKMDELKCFGINVKIMLLPSNSSSKFNEFYNRVLEIGWKQQTSRDVFSTKQKMTFYFVKMLCKIFGKDKMANYIFNKKIHDSAETKKVYRGKKKEIEISDRKYFIPNNPELCAIDLFGRDLPKAIENNSTKEHIIDENLPYDSFCKYLTDCGIDYSDICKYNREATLAMYSIKDYNAKVTSCWKKMQSVEKTISKLEKLFDD